MTTQWAVSPPCPAGVFVNILWTAQAEKTGENFRPCVLTLCSNVHFAWTLGLFLGALCGCPQWGFVAQMWAAEVSPNGWLRVGPVPSSNLELPGGCEAALSLCLFPSHVFVLHSKAQVLRYLSFLLPEISGNYVPTQEIGSNHLLQIWTWDFGSLVYHVWWDLCFRTEKLLLWRDILLTWSCWDFAFLQRLKNVTEEYFAILSKLPWSQSSLLRSGCCLARLQWREWLSKPCSCTPSSSSAGVLNPSPLHTMSLHY